jgi:hypothetical protein
MNDWLQAVLFIAAECAWLHWLCSGGPDEYRDR